MLLIHTVKSTAKWEDWLSLNNFLGIDTNTGVRFDRTLMSLQAAVDNLGVVLDSAPLSNNELKNGSLVPLFPALKAIEFRAYWLVYPHLNLRRQAVVQIREGLMSEVERFEKEFSE